MKASHKIEHLKKNASDIESRMYATPQSIKDYLESHPMKPFMLCEYMHAMGNSLGGMEEYTNLEDEYEQYQGGFVWDYVDQAIEKDGKNTTTEKTLTIIQMILTSVETVSF